MTTIPEMLTIADLKKQSSEDLEILKKQKIFYKYASFDVTSSFILRNQTLRFSQPAVFNDPFDSNEDLLDIYIDPASVREFAKKDLEKFSPDVQDKLVELATHPIAYRAALQKEKINFRICCFSTKPDNILMWSHYADKHNGICLGFKFPIMSKEFAMYPVRYIDQLRKLQGMADTALIFNYWLTRKPLCWAYESEMRAVSRSGIENISYTKGQLKEVIFGCRVTETRIASIVQQTNALGFENIIFKKMTIDPATFLLKTQQLKTQ